MSTVTVGVIDVFDPRFADDPTGAVVVPVNCLGAMGAGLALAAAKRWPEIVGPYKAVCRSEAMRPGELHVFAANRRVWLASTKRDWRDPSRGSWAIECAEQIAEMTHHRDDVVRVAVPALGCGLGGLSWRAYGPAIAEALRGGADHATIYLCPPRECR